MPPAGALGEEVPLDSTDGVSSLSFAPLGPLLLATSWDGGVRVYDVGTNRSLRSQYQQEGPVLCGTFVESGALLAGGLDTNVVRYDITTGTQTMAGKHDGAVRCVEYDADHGLVISGSWDCSVRCWDPRSNTLVANLKQPHKVYSMTQAGSRLVVATAQRTVNIYEKRMLTSGGEPEQRRESSLKYQTRCVAGYPDGAGYALSSVEGRVAMEYFDQGAESQKRKYAFKCHRKTEAGRDVAYPVNVIAFNPAMGTFVTGGCDGLVNVWDGANKKRLHQYPAYPTSVAALAFNSVGSLLAVASSYTFEQGDVDHPPDQIFVRNVGEEMRPKAKPQPR